MTPMVRSSQIIGATSIDSSRSSSVPGMVTARGSRAASGRYWATPCWATQPVMPSPTRTCSCAVLVGVLADLALPGDRDDVLAVDPVDAHVVVVDELAQLGADGRADLGHRAQVVESGAQLGDRVDLGFPVGDRGRGPRPAEPRRLGRTGPGPRDDGCRSRAIAHERLQVIDEEATVAAGVHSQAAHASLVGPGPQRVGVDAQQPGGLGDGQCGGAVPCVIVIRRGRRYARRDAIVGRTSQLLIWEFRTPCAVLRCHGAPAVHRPAAGQPRRPARRGARSGERSRRRADDAGEHDERRAHQPGPAAVGARVATHEHGRRRGRRVGAETTRRPATPRKPARGQRRAGAGRRPPAWRPASSATARSPSTGRRDEPTSEHDGRGREQARGGHEATALLGAQDAHGLVELERGQDERPTQARAQDRLARRASVAARRRPWRGRSWRPARCAGGRACPAGSSGSGPPVQRSRERRPRRPSTSRGTTTSPSPSASTSMATRSPRSLSPKGTASRSSSNVCQPGREPALASRRWSRRRRKTSGLPSSPGNSSCAVDAAVEPDVGRLAARRQRRASARLRCGAAARSRPMRQPGPLAAAARQPSDARSEAGEDEQRSDHRLPPPGMRRPGRTCSDPKEPSTRRGP